MKKNSLTATQRRNARKRAGNGAKWSIIWDGMQHDGSRLLGNPNKAERADIVAFARGLSRSQAVPGWPWQHYNAEAAASAKRGAHKFRHPNAVPSIDRGGSRGM